MNARARALASGGVRASGPAMVGIGDVVPDLTLPAVPAAVSLADLRGRGVVIVVR